jgi:hypothetical protein
LTFEPQLVGTLAMDKYVEQGNEFSPQGRFERLVNMPLDEFAPTWRQYIASLKPHSANDRKPR